MTTIEKITVELMLKKLEEVIGRKFLPVRESIYREGENLMIVIFDTDQRTKGFGWIHEDIQSMVRSLNKKGDIAALDIFDVRGTWMDINEILSQRVIRS